ncbi:amidase [Hortaea werneckii]|nr:amidase [Hortaea werneckii]
MRAHAIYHGAMFPISIRFLRLSHLCLPVQIRDSSLPELSPPVFPLRRSQLHHYSRPVLKHLTPLYPILTTHLPLALHITGKIRTKSRRLHDIRKLDIRHNVRLDVIPMHRPLLVRIREPDQVRLAPLGAHEAQSERHVRARADEVAARIHRHRPVGRDGRRVRPRQCAEDPAFAAVEQVLLVRGPEFRTRVVPALFQGAVPDGCVAGGVGFGGEGLGEVSLFREVLDPVGEEVGLQDEGAVAVLLPRFEGGEVRVYDGGACGFDLADCFFEGVEDGCVGVPAPDLEHVARDADAFAGERVVVACCYVVRLRGSVVRPWDGGGVVVVLVWAGQGLQYLLVKPTVGLIPTRLLTSLGLRIEPLVSVPSAASERPILLATPLPEDEPEGSCPGYWPTAIGSSFRVSQRQLSSDSRPSGNVVLDQDGNAVIRAVTKSTLVKRPLSRPVLRSSRVTSIRLGNCWPLMIVPVYGGTLSLNSSALERVWNFSAVLPEYHPKIAWCNDRLSEAYAVAAGIEEVVTIELHCTGDYTGSLCSIQARPIKVVGQSRPPEQSYHIEAYSTLVGPESPSRHVTSRRHGRVIVSMPAFGRSIDLWTAREGDETLTMIAKQFRHDNYGRLFGAMIVTTEHC